MNINFTYHLGDNTLEVEAEVMPIVPATRPDMRGPGDPAEGGDAEILDVQLVTDKGAVPFNIEDIYIRKFGALKDGKPVYQDLYDVLEAEAVRRMEEGL